jgi:hypothetical protein
MGYSNISYKLTKEKIDKERQKSSHPQCHPPGLMPSRSKEAKEKTVDLYYVCPLTWYTALRPIGRLATGKFRRQGSNLS